MLTMIKAMFGMGDRVATASDRLATAVEGIADDMEMLRESLRSRLGMHDQRIDAQALSAPVVESPRKRTK